QICYRRLTSGGAVVPPSVTRFRTDGICSGGYVLTPLRFAVSSGVVLLLGCWICGAGARRVERRRLSRRARHMGLDHKGESHEPIPFAYSLGYYAGVCALLNRSRV